MITCWLNVNADAELLHFRSKGFALVLVILHRPPAPAHTKHKGVNDVGSKTDTHSNTHWSLSFLCVRGMHRHRETQKQRDNVCHCASLSGLRPVGVSER